MSEQTQNNQILVIGLIVIAALLAGIVGVIVYQQMNKPAVTPVGTTQQPAAGTTPQAPAGMGQQQAAATPFDAKTATKVAAGTTPEAHLKQYNEDIINGNFADAYKLLPLDKQKSYGDAAAYEAQVKAYNITKYTMGKPVTKGDTVEIVTEQVTPQMPIAYTWTFKKVGGTWYVASRTMGGTVSK